MPSTTTTLLNASDKILNMSPDGRSLSYVESSGNNQSLFVVDLNTGDKQLVATYTSFFYVNSDSGFSSQTGFDGGVLSPNGDYILYSTGVISPNVGNNQGDTRLFVQNLRNGTAPVEVTPTLDKVGARSEASLSVQAISNDGQTVVYVEENFAGAFDPTIIETLFVQTPTGLLSYPVGDAIVSDYFDNSVKLTPDGRYLSYATLQGLTVTDLRSNTSINYGGGVNGRGATSDDGRYVAYEGVLSANSGGGDGVFVHDNSAPTAPNQVVSESAAGVVGNGNAYFIALAGDGRHVLFESDATNLVPNVTDGVTSLYVKDLDTGAISLVEADVLRTRGFGSIFDFISDDGSRIITRDSAGNIVLKQFTPPTLTVNPISQDNYINQSEGSIVTVSGSSNAIGQTVYLSIPGVPNALLHTAIATVQPNGTWSTTLSLAQLLDGGFNVDAIVSDELSTTAQRFIIIDRTPPVVAIIAVAGDNIINAAELGNVSVVGTTFIANPAGLGTVPGVVQLQIDGGGLTTTFLSQAAATVDPQLFSQALVATGVADGEHTVTLTAIDEAGNKTVLTQQVLVDTAPPNIAITSVSGDSVVSVGEIKTPQGVHGTSDAIGQTVNVLLDGVQVDQAVVQADGTWLAIVNFAGAATGQHAVTAEVDDEAGNPGQAGASVYVDQGFSVQLLSTGPNGEQGGGQGVMFPGLSADGTKLVFTGINFNLMSTAAGSSGAQVYVKDLTTGAISFVTPDPSQNAEFGAISPDGNFVEFVSDANLNPANTFYSSYNSNPLYYTYTTDLTAGATYVHYDSEDRYDGTNPDTLTPGISSGYWDQFYNPNASIAPLPVFPLAVANGGNALELVANIEPNQVAQPVVMSTLIRETVFYPATNGGAATSGSSAWMEPDASPPITNPSGAFVMQEYAPQLSADGSVAAIEARFYPEQWDTSIYPPQITIGSATVPQIYAGPIVVDPTNPTSSLVPPLPLASSYADGTPMPFGAIDPALSSDGKFVAFWSWTADDKPEVYVKNLATGELKVASSDANGVAGVGNAAGTFAAGFNTIAISADGRYVAFTSDAALTPDDAGTGADLFVKDMQTGAITRAPLPAGTFTQDLNNQLTMRADGQYIAFVTSAGLSASDTNHTSDIYGLPFASLGTPPKITMDPIDGDNRINAAEFNNNLSVSGTSDAIGQTVSLYFGGAPAFTAVVAADGTWSGSVDDTLAQDGVVALRASVASAKGASNSVGDVLTVDRVAPTVKLSTDKTHIAAGQTAIITATFSEGIGNVGANFLTATGGALGPLTFTNDHTLTALFTPNAGAATFSVTAHPGAAFDFAGNANAVGASLATGAGFDGYIVGATVRYANGSGGGVTATTDATGHFSISGGDGALVMTGGVDSATGLAFTGAYTAPAGSTILSPLTTLVETLVETTTDSAAAANAAVVLALGLPAGTDLANLDAVAGTLAGDAASTAAFKAGSQLYDDVALIAAAGGSTSAALAAFAAAVASGAPLNLVDAATVAAVATAANLGATAAGAVGSIAAATGAALDRQLASATTPGAVLIDITGASIAQQGGAAAALAAAPQNATEVADSYIAGLAATLTASDAAAANNIAAACYGRGARIATMRGEVAIEALAIGELVVTASGAVRPVVWLGHRSIDATRHPDPAAVWPVVVRAHAFGENLPHRDLWLSPGHNVACDDALTPISALANGQSIAQIHQDRVEYWHVELDAHDVILAEGLPAESYLDTGNRTAFANGGGFIEAHPDFAPRHWADTCLPLVQRGPAVVATKARLLARLAERGWTASAEADAYILVDGARIESMRLSPTRLGFVLPEGGREIALRSNVFVPAHTVAENTDDRELGLCLGRLQIDGADVALAVDLCGAAGWREAEFAEGRFSHRWTTGETPLPPGARVVLLDLAGDGRYWRSPAEEEAARFA